MFERFTDRARQCVVLAQQAARDYKSDYIDIEHLLIGLINENDGVAAKALKNLDITVSKLDKLGLIPDGLCSPKGHIPFTDLAKRCLGENALREALQLGHNYIGTEHILLGLIRYPKDERIHDILDTLGIDFSQVRKEIISLLSGYTSQLKTTQTKEETIEVPISLLKNLKLIYDGDDTDLPKGYGCNILGGWGKSSEIQAIIDLLPREHCEVCGQELPK